MQKHKTSTHVSCMKYKHMKEPLKSVGTQSEVNAKVGTRCGSYMWEFDTSIKIYELG